MLKGKTVILGVTGSIAAYKIANLTSMLVKMHCDVYVIMTQNATNFINPITFETLTNHKTLVDTFDRNFNYNIEHVSLAKKADVVLIAPASANVIGKIAGGIADDMLTTTVMACRCKKIISPAMNTGMYENPILQDNLKKLKRFGYEIIEPDTGLLACKDVGAGKMPSEQVLLQHILREIRFEKDMTGRRVVVTAGPTKEAIDPVRYITNHSTGKMGYAIANVAAQRGAEVVLITGETSIEKPPFVRTIEVVSAEDMFNAVVDTVEENTGNDDIVIMSAAVADYTPANVADEKIKKADGAGNIELKRTKDILKYLGENRRGRQFLCGFSMETENMLENSRKKLQNKNIDMIVANNLKVAGAGFGTDTNIITVITKNETEELPIMSKDEAAIRILDKILENSKEN
ncbi:bifunctional phosphopantothenoylcysteine decarboxylase/phosphopantothenate--cysteine ligase CoaBC [Lachnospiraceae bacterium HCP1S3_C3]|nr:bifunctional phosphopantothenoylcysteine decarboxylase/phosphopantothenate--cysteine ligase CoaBC [Lachnospiraceae bacterium]